MQFVHTIPLLSKLGEKLEEKLEPRRLRALKERIFGDCYWEQRETSLPPMVWRDGLGAWHLIVGKFEALYESPAAIRSLKARRAALLAET